MSKYYGQVSGQARTTASRRGSAASGIKSSVQSWDGSIIMYLRDTRHGENQLRVEAKLDDSSFSGETIFDGPLKDFINMCLMYEEGI